MLTITTQEYSRTLLGKLRTQHQRIPLSGLWELTYHCNLNCVHCYCAPGRSDNCHSEASAEESGTKCHSCESRNPKTSLDSHFRGNDKSPAGVYPVLRYGAGMTEEVIEQPRSEPNKKELSYDKIKNIIDQIVDSGCLWITFTGGEVFRRPDFLDIYTYAQQKGLIITLLTNGTLISTSIVKHLKEYPPSMIEITLYGRTKETYEKITRVKGSYARCLKTIRLLREHKIPFLLKTMLLTLNKHELWEIKRFAQELGSPNFRFDPFVHSGCNGSKEPLAYRLPAEEAVEMELQDPDRMEYTQSYFDQHAGRTIKDFPYQYKCGAGRTMFAINPYGEMNICMASRVLDYDLRHKPFDYAFDHLFPGIINAPRDNLYQECSDCKLFGFCHQCPAKSQREHGHADQIVKYNCQRARLLARGLQMAENRRPMADDRKLIKSHSNRDS